MASPVHLGMWKQDRASTVVMAYNDDEPHLINTLRQRPDATLNRVERFSGLGRFKVIKKLARFIRYNIAEVRSKDERFVFGLTVS